MSKTTVKKALEGLSREQLVEMILELYAARKEAKEYLDFWADPDVERELEKATLKINRLFFLSADKPRKKPKLSSVKSTVKSFMELVADRDTVCRLYISLLETLRRWAQANDYHVSGGFSKWEKLLDSIEAYASSDADLTPAASRLTREAAQTRETLSNVPDTPRRRRRYFGWYR